MATLTDESSYWEKAQQEGFDLSWLKQVEENVIGDSVADVSNAPELGVRVDQVPKGLKPLHRWENHRLTRGRTHQATP